MPRWLPVVRRQESAAHQKPKLDRNIMRKPTYVKMTSPNGKYSVILRWRSDYKLYWKDAGEWGVDSKTIKGELYVVGHSPLFSWMDGLKLTPATYEDWIKDGNRLL